jgi:hypothetical protein
MLRSASRVFVAASVAAATLTGCYVVPVAPDGTPIHGPAAIAVPVAPAPIYTAPMPSLLQARLYPSNEAASQSGMLSGTVTNMMTGKGRFQLQYAGEVLAGEATRVSGEERKGIASAYGASGSFMSCEYQMHTAMQGAGTCMFSNGAKYKVHIGN